jgi:hypothetical protein
MCLFPALILCSVELGQYGSLDTLDYNSRFDEFNSRLAGANSRFALLRELAGKGLIRLTVCAAKPRRHGENRRISRFDGNLADTDRDHMTLPRHDGMT